MSPHPVPWLQDGAPLPPTDQALGADTDTPGLLALGGRLEPAQLEQAYRRGVFPWFGPGLPTMWWAPDPRMVLPVAAFKISPSLRKTLRRFVRTPGCEVRVDSAFDRVIRACARTPRAGQHGTWIVPELLAAYSAWHRLGRVHSVETWVHGELLGGLYGVGLGRMFFGESMFSHASDASKIALAALVALCRAQGIAWVDCQQNTRHLASLGAHEVPRPRFEAHLKQVLAQPEPERWTYDPAWWALLGLEQRATFTGELGA